MTDIETIAIVGASLAGAKAAEALRAEGYDGRVVLVGEEQEQPYVRPPLTKEYLRGEAPQSDAFVHPSGWYDEQRIELRLGVAVTAIDPAARVITLADGARLRYDRALLATGATPRRLEVPGGDLPGVHYLRTIGDADRLREAAAAGHRAVVIGGGWIGAEAAASLRQLGLDVALIVGDASPLERVLGPDVARIYRDLHTSHDVDVVSGQRAAAFHGTTRVVSVETTGGRVLDADLVVVGVGARPRTELAEAAGLAVRGGIVVDERLETTVPGIFAAGDVAAAWHPVFGTHVRVEHWDNARRQGRVAARNMLGLGEAYDRIPYFYSDQFELGMEYAGYAPAWDRVVVRREAGTDAFLAFWLEAGRVVAGMNANTWEVNDAIAALVASRQVVDADRLADPSVPLGDLAPVVAAGAANG